MVSSCSSAWNYSFAAFLVGGLMEGYGVCKDRGRGSLGWLFILLYDRGCVFASSAAWRRTTTLVSGGLMVNVGAPTT